MLNGVEVSDMGNPQLETILKNKNSLFARKEKSIAKYVKENVRRQDEAYLRKVKEITNAMDALDKQVDAISKKMGKNAKGQTNEEIEAIGMTQRELMNRLLAAQDERIEELRKDYEKGKITKYFFEKRAEQLSSGNIKDLKNECNIEELGFKKTTELEPFNGIIGQERALEAVKTAMQIYQRGPWRTS